MAATTDSPPTDVLSPWLLPRITSLYTTLPTEQDDSDFEAMFMETFASEAKVLLNHESVTLDVLRQHLGAGKFAMKRGVVDFRDVIEIVRENEGEYKEGVVAGFYTVTRDLKFRIRAGPARTASYNSFSAKIASDLTLPHTLPDRRRITELFLTTLDKAVPVHIHLPAGVTKGGGETVKPSDVEKK